MDIPWHDTEPGASRVGQRVGVYARPYAASAHHAANVPLAEGVLEEHSAAAGTNGLIGLTRQAGAYGNALVLSARPWPGCVVAPKKMMSGV